MKESGGWPTPKHDGCYLVSDLATGGQYGSLMLLESRSIPSHNHHGPLGSIETTGTSTIRKDT